MCGEASNLKILLLIVFLPPSSSSMSCIPFRWEGGLQLYSFHNSCHPPVYEADNDGWRPTWESFLIRCQSYPATRPHIYSYSHYLLSTRSAFPSIVIHNPGFSDWFPHHSSSTFPIFLAFSPLQALACGCVVWEPSWPPGAPGGWAPYGPRLHHTAPPMHGLLCYAMLCSLPMHGRVDMYIQQHRLGLEKWGPPAADPLPKSGVQQIQWRYRYPYANRIPISSVHCGALHALQNWATKSAN